MYFVIIVVITIVVISLTVMLVIMMMIIIIIIVIIAMRCRPPGTFSATSPPHAERGDRPGSHRLIHVDNYEYLNYLTCFKHMLNIK